MSEEIEEGEEYEEIEEIEEIDETAETVASPHEQEEGKENVFESMPIESTDIIIIAGKRRSGKTVLMTSLIKAVEPEFEKATLAQLGTAKKFRKIDPLMEFQDQGGIYIRPNDTIKYNEQLKEMFKNRNEFIVTDESDKFFKNRESLSNVQSDFIDIGRHWGLGGMFVTRRLAKLHTDLVANANKIFLFKLWTKADLDYLRGADLGDFVPIVAKLEKYQFLGIDLDNNTYTVFDPI